MDFFTVIGRLGVFAVIAFAFSLFGTKIAIAVLPRFGLLDQPGGRHIHAEAVPRGGGIAIVLAFFLSFGAYALWRPAMPDIVWRLAIPGVILAFLGLADDRYDLPAIFKLAVQIFCALIVYFLDPRTMTFGDFVAPGYLTCIFTVFWVIAIVNAFNLIDGLDGVAGGVSSVSAGCLAVWFLLMDNHVDEAAVMFILLGCCLGFLRYNFHPAKIFLGDTGSTFLGFVFAVTGLSGVDRAATLTSLLIPVLALGVPLFDEMLAVWRRVVRKILNPSGAGVMSGDQDHLHHRLFRKTGAQSRTALYLYYLSAGFAVLALLVMFCRQTVSGLAFFLLALCVLVAVRMLAIPEIFASALLFGRGISLPRKSVLFNVFHPLFDMAVICGSLMLSFRLLHFAIPPVVALLLLAPLSLLLLFSGIYRVYWLRASMGDYTRLAKLIFSGAVLSGVLFAFIKYRFGLPASGVRFVIVDVMFFLMIFALICGERFFIRYAEGLWLYKLQQSRMMSGGTRHRALIYGGGLYSRLFIDFHFRAGMKEECDFVGIIDDDPALQGLRINGLRVVGASADLENIYRKDPFDTIVIASRNITPERLRTVEDFARAHQLKRVRFSVQEEVQLFGDR
ncbi:MAG: hypothetical protein MJ016_03975 [Victivallaceae bacterium]|nr:hypothetical protein [Victivallaceae bacterium]